MPWLAGFITSTPESDFSVRTPYARLETSSEYRRFAVECDRLAQLAEMERHRKILERMAEAWRTLAEEEKSQR